MCVILDVQHVGGSLCNACIWSYFWRRIADWNQIKIIDACTKKMIWCLWIMIEGKT